MSGSGACSLRVALVDDSAVARRVIRSLLEQEPGIGIAWEAANGRQALERLAADGASRPDAILLDLEMPELDGLATLDRLRAMPSRPQVVVLSALTRRGARETLEALSRGAIDYICKPQASDPGALAELRQELLRKLRLCAPVGRSAAIARPQPQSDPRAGRVKEGSGAALPATTAAAPPRPPSRPCGVFRPGILGVAASTGGPQALATLFSALRPALPIPVLITQHMPPGFTAALAEHLERVTGHHCAEARDGEAAEAGRIYLAPGGWHLLLEGRGPWRLRLSDAPPVHYCRPAADPMFASMAECAGERTLAVVLTGLGCDGAEGAARIAGRGGLVIAQDESTSVVWGMPGATVRRGAAHFVLSLDRIPEAISQLVAVA